MKFSLIRSVALLLIAIAVLVVGVNLLLENEEESVYIDVDSLWADEETDIVTTTASASHDLDTYEPTVEDIETVTVATTVEEVTETVEATSYSDNDSDTVETTVAATTRTVITSRARKDYDQNSVYIDMENILQLPELPTGCEITALTILLRYYGFNAEKTYLASNYLPTSWGNAQYIDGKTYKDSFFYYFIGDPFSTGYGCFSYAIETAANSYIADNGGGYTVKNISGCSADTLYEYLIAGTPVLCWATDGMIEPEYYETWYDNATGEQLDWYLNEHCFVLVGFDISANTVTLNDPMKGIIDYNIDKFETRWAQMYSQAIVIIPNSTSSTTEETTTIEINEEEEEEEIEEIEEETTAETEEAFVDAYDDE